MITEWLTPEKINIVNSVKDWKEAVILCSQPLLLQNFISPEYIDVIFTTHEELGPYYVIAPGLALPHARPEQGVIKTGLSLLHVKEGVFFGSHANDPVYVIIMMCAISGNEHINLISSLAEIFSDEDKLSRLINASSLESIDKVITIKTGYK